MTEICARCEKQFDREKESTEYVTNYHDIYCDECWEEMSHQ